MRIIFMKKDPKELEAFYEKCSSVTENAAGWTVAAILEMDESVEEFGKK